MTRTALPRGEVREDFYPTPAWVTRAIVPELRAMASALAPTVFVDPCAGDGAILSVLREEMRSVPRRGMEINQDRQALATKDDLRVELRDAIFWSGSGFSWHAAGGIVVMNPPFSAALEFVTRALQEARGGAVVALLRLAFLESQERVAFHREHPSDVFVLPKRPSFCASLRCAGAPALMCSWATRQAIDAPRPKACPVCGSRLAVSDSDSAAYAWFRWGGGSPGGSWAIL